MRPSIGRVVHYVHPDTGAHMPALVLAVQLGGKMGGESIALRAFGHTPADDTFASAAVVDLTGTVPGSWHWPEREDALFPSTSESRLPLSADPREAVVGPSGDGAPSLAAALAGAALAGGDVFVAGAPAGAAADASPEAPEGAPGAESRTETPIDEAPPEYVPVVESPAAESGDSRPA